LEAVFSLNEKVDSNYQVGWALGANTDNSIRDLLIPKHLNSELKINKLVSGYIRRRYYFESLKWLGSIEKDKWSEREKVAFLSKLPFDKNNPYIKPENPSQHGHNTFGGHHLYHMVVRIANIAQKHAWYHKWGDRKSVV